VTYLDPSASQLGHKGSIADTARVLGRSHPAWRYSLGGLAVPGPGPAGRGATTLGCGRK